TSDPNPRTWNDVHAGLDRFEDGARYTYRVRAYSPVDGLSGATNRASTATNLPSPLQLWANGVTSSSVALNWVDNTPDESGYEIWQWGAADLPAPGEAQHVATVQPHPGTGGMGYTVGGLSAGSKYHFYVRAVSADNVSMPTIPIAVTTSAGISGPDAG